MLQLEKNQFNCEKPILKPEKTQNSWTLKLRCFFTKYSNDYLLEGRAEVELESESPDLT